MLPHNRLLLLLGLVAGAVGSDTGWKWGPPTGVPATALDPLAAQGSNSTPLPDGDAALNDLFEEEDAVVRGFVSSPSNVQDNVSNADQDPTVQGETSSHSPQEEKPPPTRIPYSRPPTNESYASKDEFKPRGMEHLYYVTNLFLSLVNRQEEVPPSLAPFISEELKKMTFDKEQGLRIAKGVQRNWTVLLVHYIGTIALIVLGLLLAGIMPIAGLVFACCRCGGRCGAEEPCYDKKSDPCKRRTLGTLLAIFVVVVMLGLVCTFVTNDRMETGIQTFPQDMRSSISDTKLYLNNTHKQLDTLYVQNFQELQAVLFNKLDSSGELVKSELARVSKAIAIDNLTAIASSLGVIKQDLDIILNTTLALQEETSYLASGLQDVAERLNELRRGCEGIPECTNLITNYADKLEINNAFEQLPSVEAKLQEVTRLIRNDIEVEVKRGKRAFDSIATEIQNKVQRSIPEIKNKILETGGELQEASRSVHQTISAIDYGFLENKVDTVELYIQEYNKYRYWAFFIGCSVLLLITGCFAMGVVFGCCGKRPDETTSCYRTSGATWLMWGVGLTFLLSAVILVATSALFLIGTASEVFICNPLNDPSNSEVFAIIAKEINLQKSYPDGKAPELVDIIRYCHQNSSIHTVLKLDAKNNHISKLTNYRKRMNLDEQIEKLKRVISVDTNIKILTRDAKQQLRELASSELANKSSWDHYTNILEQHVLKINLLDLAAKLNQTADSLPAGYGAVSVKLKNDALFLEGLRRWLSSIQANTQVLKETTDRLSENLKFNKTSLGLAIQDLIKEAEFAQKYLKVNGSEQVSELVNRFTEDFLADVDDYVKYVKNKIFNEVGRCGPMSSVYNATVSSVCKDVMYPFNGYWASMGWCFLFFIPCMILAVELTSLYRKTEPYSGHLNESNASAFLNSGYDKKQRRHSRDYECGHIGSSYTSNPYAGSHTSPSRPEYDQSVDGGPPRYTSQPSLSPEYERPPPYYYPGPGNS